MATQSAQVNVQVRTTLGSRANKRLRDQGLIPGVVYGHKEAVVPLTMPRKEVTVYISRGAHLFDLSIDGKSEKVLIKEVQYDHLGKDVIHVDFARVSLDEKVTVTVAIELKGEPKGEEDGGVLQQIINELEVECLVTDIPDVIRVNVSEMALDDVIHIRDLKLPAGVVAMQDEDLIVCAVHEIKEEADAEAEVADSGEPEVIGRTEEEAAEGEDAPK